jgi:spore coat protein A
VRIAWANDITGPFPVLAVEKQGATPGPGRDGAKPLADVAALPAWTVVHLHGARTNAWNDGLADNAILSGSTQLSEYPNDQPATTLWYHDHAMSITALNVMTGLAGMYLIRDDEEDALHLPDGEHEIPLIICDRNLDTDDGTPNGNLTGQLLHKVNTFFVPVTNERVTGEFRGPFNLVNGRIWPHLDVKGRWYRFRMLNASNARFYTLELRNEAGARQTGVLQLIGTDGGLLPKPVALDQLTLAPAERADVLIDFSAFKGKSLTLVNTHLPEQTNPEVMQFRVRKQKVHNPFHLPDTLSPSFTPLTHDNLPSHNHRWLVLTPPNPNTANNPNPPVPGDPEMWEMQEVEAGSVATPSDGIVQIKDDKGKVHTLQRVARDFEDATNYFVEYDRWEQWNILNIDGSVLSLEHPIHIHLIGFQLLSRDKYDTSKFDLNVGGSTSPLSYKCTLPDDPSEKGWKDTIRVPPGQMVHVAGQFGGGTGRYMYHCHILEHEDHGMMRPFDVEPAQVMKVDPHMGGGSHEHMIAHRVTPGPALGGPVPGQPSPDEHVRK